MSTYEEVLSSLSFGADVVGSVRLCGGKAYLSFLRDNAASINQAVLGSYS